MLRCYHSWQTKSTETTVPLGLSRVLFWGPDRTSGGRPLSTWIVVVPSFCSVSCNTGSSQPTLTVSSQMSMLNLWQSQPGRECTLNCCSAEQEKRNVKRKRNHLDPVMVASTISPIKCSIIFFFFFFAICSFSSDIVLIKNGFTRESGVNMLLFHDNSIRCLPVFPFSNYKYGRPSPGGMQVQNIHAGRPSAVDFAVRSSAAF